VSGNCCTFAPSILIINRYSPVKVEAVFFIAGGVVCTYPENVTTMLLQLLGCWLVGISEKPLFIGILQS